MLGTKAILDALSALKGKKAKLDLLKAHANNNSLKTFFRLALDPRLSFFYKKEILDADLDKALPYPSNIDVAYQLLETMVSGGDMRGQVLESYLYNMLASLPSADRECIRRVLRKKPDCGVGVGTVNKVWPDLIYVQPYSGCVSDKAENVAAIPYPAVVDLKEAGSCVMVEWKDGQVTFRARSGDEYNFGDTVRSGIKVMLQESNSEDLVLCCEGLVRDMSASPAWDAIAGRWAAQSEAKSNGALNKALLSMNGKLDNGVVVMLIVHDCIAWDTYIGKDIDQLPLDTYNGDHWARRDFMESILECAEEGVQDSDHPYYIGPIRNNYVFSESEARELSDKYISFGYEGAVLKSMEHRWVNGRPSTAVKLKALWPADLRVVGYAAGEGQFANEIGALLCVTEDSDNPLSVYVGTGLTVEDRRRPFSDWENQIVTVHYHRLSEGGNSLQLPRFRREAKSTVFSSCVRLDKVTANLLHELV